MEFALVETHLCVNLAMEEEDHYFDEENEGDGLPPQEWKSVLASAATALNNSNGCFDCNICLDNAVDPIVTLCGHLYCWPCIYKWLHFQNNDSTSIRQQQQQCPVCKTCISQTTLIPLYGRGHSIPHTQFKENKSYPTLNVPRRPSTCGVLHSLIATSRRHHRSRDYNLEETSSMPTTPTGLHSTVGMFGQMIYGRVFGNSESEDGLYWYPNSYNHIGRMSSSSSPRVRRQEMQAVKSLNRISIFLFCCVICCLILF